MSKPSLGTMAIAVLILIAIIAALYASNAALNETKETNKILSEKLQEMRDQRDTAYSPNIVLKNSFIQINTEDRDIFISHDFDPEEEYKYYDKPLILSWTNLGAGIAKDITLTFRLTDLLDQFALNTLTYELIDGNVRLEREAMEILFPGRMLIPREEANIFVKESLYLLPNTDGEILIEFPEIFARAILALINHPDRSDILFPYTIEYYDIQNVVSPAKTKSIVFYSHQRSIVIPDLDGNISIYRPATSHIRGRRATIPDSRY